MSEGGVRRVLEWLTRLRRAPGNRHEALALAVHGLLVAHGFRPAEVAPDEGGDAAATTALPEGWGAAGFGGRYRHARSAMTFDVRAVPVGARLVVHAATVEDDARMHTLELRVDDHVAADVDLSTLAADGADWAPVFTRLRDLATLVQVNIAHRLVPDAAKDGYEEAAAATAQERPAAASGSSRAPRPPPPLPDAPLLPGRGRDDDFDDDPLRIGRPRRPGVPVGGGFGGLRPPYGLGHDDILAPGLPGRLDGMGAPGGGYGGNLMGPRHPGFGGPGGLGGGPQGLPPGVPPGARFDPYYPPNPDGGYGPGGGVGPMRPRQPPQGPGSGVPDNDMEQPPPPDNELELPGGNPRGPGFPGRGGDPDGPPPDMYW